MVTPLTVHKKDIAVIFCSISKKSFAKMSRVLGEIAKKHHVANFNNLNFSDLNLQQQKIGFYHSKPSSYYKSKI